MKTVPLREVCHLLRDKSFVSIGDFEARISNQVEYNADPNHVFLELYWEVDELPFFVSFATKDNKTIQVDNQTLRLVSTDGDIEQVTVIE